MIPLNSIVNMDDLGPAVERAITGNTMPAPPAVINGYALARQFEEALDHPTPAEAAYRDGMRLELRGRIHQILTLSDGEIRRPLSVADRNALHLFHNRLGQPENAQNRPELQRHLGNAIQILHTKLGIAGQTNETIVRGVLDPTKRFVIGQIPPSLAQAREAIIKLKTKITYYAVNRAELAVEARELREAINTILGDEIQQPHNPNRDAEEQTILPLWTVLGRLADVNEELPQKQDVIPHLKRVYDILDRHINEKSGMVPLAYDGAVQTQRKLGIDGAMLVVDFYKERNSETGPILIAQDQPRLTLMDFLKGMSAGLATYFAPGGGELFSRDAAKAKANALLWTLEGALDSVRGKEDFDPICRNLEGLIADTRALAQNDRATLTELYNLVGRSMEQLNSVNIYINNLVRIPQLGTGSTTINETETPFIGKIASLDRILNPETDKKGKDYYKEQADLEKNKFITNTKNFAILKIIYEIFCGLEADAQLYLNIIYQINQRGQQQPNDDFLRTELFNELERKAEKIGFRKQIARIAYPLISYLLNYFVEKLGTDYLDEAFNYIESSKFLRRGQEAANPEQGQGEADAVVNANNEEEETALFNSLKKTIITNFSRYLSSANGAYDRVAKNPIPNDTLPNMHQKEMARAEVYDGVSPEELYGAFAKFIIDKCMGDGPIAWLVNFFIGGSIVEGIIDESVGSIMDANGYTHALNSVFVDLLKEILTTIKDNEQKGVTNPIPTYEDPDSRKNRDLIRALVKNLFEVLQKNNCKTQDELKALLKGTSLTQNLKKMGDDFFMEDVVESVADVLTLAIKELVTDEQLYKLIYNFTKQVNKVYETGENYSRREIREKEIELAHLTDQLITVSISTAVKDKFDFKGSREHAETNKQIDLLRQETQTLVDTASRGLGEIEQSIGNDNPTELADMNLLAQMKTIAEAASKYLKTCHTDRFTNKGSKLGSHNIDRLEARYRTADKKADHFVEHIKTMYEKQQQIAIVNKLNAPVNGIRGILAGIQNQLNVNREHTLDEIRNAENQILTLEDHLRTTESVIQHRDIADLKRLLSPLAISLTVLRRSTEVVAFHGSLQIANAGNDENGQPRPWTLQQIMAARRNYGACPNAVKEQIELFKRQIQNVPFSDANVQWQLIRELDKIQDNLISSQRDAAYREFMRIADEARPTAELLRTQKETIGRNSQAIHNRLGHIAILAPNYIRECRQQIRASFPEVQRGLAEIRRSYIDSHLINAEKNASELLKEIEVKIAELEEVEAHQQANREAELCQTLTPKIQAVGASMEALMQNAPAVFHDAGVVHEDEVNLQQADLDALAEKLTQFHINWQNGLPAGVTLEQARISAQELRDLLVRLQRSEHNAYERIPYHNVHLSDMRGFRDLVTGIVVKRVKERADNLIDMATSEGFIRHGLILRMALIPHLEYNNALPKPKKKGLLG